MYKQAKWHSPALGVNPAKTSSGMPGVCLYNSPGVGWGVGTPLFGLNGYVPLNRVWFPGSSVLNWVYKFTFYHLKQGVILDWKP